MGSTKTPLLGKHDDSSEIRSYGRSEIEERDNGANKSVRVNTDEPESSSSRAVKALTRQMSSVRNTVLKNLQSLTQREENVHELEEVTTNLKNDSQSFKGVSSEIKNREQAKNKRLGKMLIFVTILLLFLILVFILVAVYV